MPCRVPFPPPPPPSPRDADVPAAETRDRDGWGYPVRRDQTHGALAVRNSFELIGPDVIGRAQWATHASEVVRHIREIQPGANGGAARFQMENRTPRDVLQPIPVFAAFFAG